MAAPAKVDRVLITGHETPAPVGTPRRLSAIVVGPNGKPIPGAAITWGVVGTTPARAVVSGDTTGGGASLTPLAPGAVTLTATSRGVTGKATLTVVKAVAPVPPPDPTPTPAITVSVSPTSRTVVQGAAVSVTVTITRTGGYTGAVTIAVTGRPTGVTASALTLGVGVTSGTLTLTAGDAAALGGASLTLTASGSGVASVTTPLTLTVTAPVVVTPPTTTRTVQLYRGAAGSGSDLAVGAFWFPPGQFTVAQHDAGYGKLTIGGVEQTYASEIRPGPGVYHPDGSLRLVHAQATRALSADTIVTAVLDLTALRAATPPVASTASIIADASGATIYDRGIKAVLATVEPTANCASGCFSTTVPKADNPTTEIPWLVDVEAFLDDRELHVARAWDGTISGLGTGTRYERDWFYWTQFARTGDIRHLHRGVAQYCAWHVAYAGASGPGEPFASPRTWKLAYWMLRADRAHDLLLGWVNEGRGGSAWVGFGTAFDIGDGRDAGRAAQAILDGLDIGITGTGGNLGFAPLDAAALESIVSRLLNEPGVALYTGEGAVPAWTTSLGGADATLYPVEHAAGYGVLGAGAGATTMQVVFPDQNGTVPYHFGFQHAIVMGDVLLEWWDRVEPRPMILTRLRQQCAYWWDHFRVTATGYVGERFLYSNLSNPADINSGAADLNGFYRRCFYKLAELEALAGNVAAATTALAHGDALLHATLATPGDGKAGPFIAGISQQKQFDEFAQHLGPDLGKRALAKAAIVAAGG